MAMRQHPGQWPVSCMGECFSSRACRVHGDLPNPDLLVRHPLVAALSIPKIEDPRARPRGRAPRPRMAAILSSNCQDPTKMLVPQVQPTSSYYVCDEIIPCRSAGGSEPFPLPWLRASRKEKKGAASRKPNSRADFSSHRSQDMAKPD